MKEEIIYRIKQTARIEEVIGNLVEIHKDGANLKCKCPFHNDTHPSLKINVAKQYWRCFVCDKGGDAIEFVKEYKRCNYIEALEEIAKQYHIDTSDREVHKAYNADEKYTKAQKRMMYAAGSMAEELSAYLFSGEGENALRYLKEERGLSEETIKAFRLGYASDDDGLHIKNLRREGYNSDDFRNLKMLDTNYKGEEYFAYKGRLMFPIVEEEKGRVVSFAGRILPGNEKGRSAKYINGKESDTYKKSDVLYGLFQAKESIRNEKQAYITEGYCDVISMHQKGICNTVASCGTALTENQIALLKEYVPTVKGMKHVTVMYDSDVAGMAANLRNGKLLMKAGFNVRMVQLPQGEDPDSFCLSHTADEVKEYLKKNTQPLLKLMVEQAIAKSGDDYREELEIIREFLDKIG